MRRQKLDYILEKVEHLTIITEFESRILQVSFFFLTWEQNIRESDAQPVNTRHLLVIMLRGLDEESQYREDVRGVFFYMSKNGR